MGLSVKFLHTGGEKKSFNSLWLLLLSESLGCNTVVSKPLVMSQRANTPLKGEEEQLQSVGPSVPPFTPQSTSLLSTSKHKMSNKALISGIVSEILMCFIQVVITQVISQRSFMLEHSCVNAILLLNSLRCPLPKNSPPFPWKEFMSSFIMLHFVRCST